MNLKGKFDKRFLVLFSSMLVILVCFAVIVNAYPAWAPNTAYAVGTMVTYGGNDYKCIQAHTSLVGWEPPNVPALWQLIGPSSSASPSASPTATKTPSVTPCVTLPIPTPTKTPTVTASKTPTPSTSPTATKTPTSSNSPTATKTPTVTASKTPTVTATVTPVSGIVLSINGNVLTWTDSANGNDYHVYKNNGWIAWTANRTYTVSGVNGDQFYVTNGSGSVKSNTVTYGSVSSTPTPTATISAGITPTVTPTATKTPSVTPSVIPTPSQINSSLPKRIMSGYWHTWSSGVPFIKLRDVNPNWDVINVAFCVPVSAGSTDGRMTFSVYNDGTYSDADFKNDIITMHNRGKKIVLSIGGYEGFFSLGSSGAVTTFVNAVKGYINSYGFDGIDIDLEQSSLQFNPGADPDFANPVSPKVVNMISALNQICDSYGNNFILSFAPETFYLQLGYQFYGGLNAAVDARAGVYIPVIYALGSHVTYVQAQLYNSGPILALDGRSYTMGDAASIVAMCDMVMKGFNLSQNASHHWPGLRPDQVVIGLPASAGAAGSGQVSNATLQSAFSTLNSTYPTLRGIMAWSINWDNYQNSNQFAIGNRAYLNTLP